jgi:bacteriocin-like protein
MDNLKPEEVKDLKKKKELSEEDLKKVSGGATGDVFLKLDGIEGESADDKIPPRID